MPSRFLRSLSGLWVMWANLCYGDDNLNSGYSKLLALSSTTDISASSLTADGLRYTKYSLPYQFDEVINTENYAVSVQVRGNYLNVKSTDFELGSLGQFRARWDIWSAALAPKLTYRLNDQVSAESELALGYAYMRNHSMFHCNEPVNNALRDAGSIHVGLLMPKVGLKAPTGSTIRM